MMPSEMLTEIALRSEITTLSCLSKTNKTICDNQFWINKLQYEQYPTVKPKCHSWLRFYDLLTKAKIYIDRLTTASPGGDY